MSSGKSVSLAEAIEKKAKRFFTGVPCNNGHVAERRVIGQHCVECHRINAKRQRERDAISSAEGRDHERANKAQVAAQFLADGRPTLDMLLKLHSVGSVEDAILDGRTRYFTGNPCKYGHIDLRRTANGSCTACEWRKKYGSDDRRKQYLVDAIYEACTEPALPEWPLISREDAVAQRLPRFYMREVCKNGHTGPRYVGNNECTLCSSKRNRDRYAADPAYRAHRISYETERNRRPEVRRGRLVKMSEYNRRPDVRGRLLTRIKEDPLFKLEWNLRTLLRNALKKTEHKKTTKLQTILGCTVAEFKRHMERQFAEGMNWTNHGDWEMDHIVPLSSATTGTDVVALFHHTNYGHCGRPEIALKARAEIF